MARRWLGPPVEPLEKEPARTDAAAPPLAVDTAADRSAAIGAPEHPPQRPNGWLRWGRWVMLGLIIVIGATRWNVELWDGYPVAVGMASAALASVFTLHLYGFLAWAVIRGLLRRRAWTYVRVTYSPLLLSLVLLGVLAYPAVRAQQDALTREDIDREADALLTETPDPVGMKLAGRSDTLSEDDMVALNERAALGVRFGTMLTKTLTDYNSSKVSADAWIASTRSRLQRADRALSGLRQRTSALTDVPVKTQLRRFDRVRGRTLTAFNRLLEALVVGADERGPQKLVNRRLRSYQAEGRRIADLMQPYLTAEQRRVFERGRL